MHINICPFCKKDYQTKNKKQKFCSGSCRNKARKKLAIVLCEYCGKEFKTKRNGKATSRFCSTYCVGKWNTDRPEMKKILSESGKKGGEARKKRLKEDPEFAKRMSNFYSKRMKENNPFFDPKTIAKARETKRINKTLHVWSGKRGGNGQYTESQKLLSCSLGWKMEVVIKTHHSPFDKSGFPTNYKVDIGNEELKIGIEIDGKGHKLAKNKKIDNKKVKKLNELGWKILRFTNKEVIENLENVLLKIKKEIKRI